MALLDTHVLLWWATDRSRLSTRATKEIARAREILVSPVSFWELATLVRRGMIRLDAPVHDWSRDVLAQEDVSIAELTPGAAASAGLLGETFPADPADRFLYATARELAVPFISKDQRIRDFALDARDVKVVW